MKFSDKLDFSHSSYLSITSLIATAQLAINKNAFKQEITLHIAKGMEVYAKEVIKAINAQSKENPFSPFVNTVIDDDIPEHCWYLDINGYKIGADVS